MLKVAALLAAIGAITGFTTAQFLPRRYISRTTVAFTTGVSKDRASAAAGQTLSGADLTPIVLQSAYYKAELDYTPVEELVERIQNNGLVRILRIGNRDGFSVEFTDADRYASLDMTRVLAEEMARNAGAPTQVVNPLRAGMTGPGPGLCMLFGIAGGLAMGLLLSAITRAKT